MPELQEHAAWLADDDGNLVDAIRGGDERAFCTLLDRYGPAMLRFALLHSGDSAVAEDAVQDAWIAVLRGIDRFEQRSSLRTWIFQILLFRLRARLKRELRTISFSALDAQATVEAERFLDADHPHWPHHWKTPPEDWGDTPEEHLLSAEVRARLARAISALPAQQRDVITLRDIEGWSSAEVCRVLGLSESNQRVLLHRARARVRRELADYFAEG